MLYESAACFMRIPYEIRKLVCGLVEERGWVNQHDISPTTHIFQKHTTCVAFEGFVLYAGGDYTLYPNIMLLVQVMAFVMSGMFAAYIVG